MANSCNEFSAIFDRHFEKYKDCPLLLYGTGINAKRIIDGAIGYDIAGLISIDHVGEIIYGKQVMDLENALKLSNIIILAASPEAKSIIYNRIRDQVPKDTVILDMWGDDMSSVSDFSQNKYWNQSQDDLLNEIKRHDVISFDFFDTLVVRRTYDLKSFFAYIQCQLSKEDINIPYAQWRLLADEDAFQKKDAPTLGYIVELMSEYGLDRMLSDHIIDIEFELEKSILVCRKTMRKIYEYAVKAGKKVAVTTDTYYSAAQISELLSAGGYSRPDVILSSCDNGCSKNKGGLFRILMKKYNSQSILHIGDDQISDIEVPKNMGIDTFYVMSAKKMLESSSIGYVGEAVQNVYDAWMLGSIVVDIFNDPFGLSKSKGKLYIDSIEKLASVCIKPITMAFMSFICEYASQNDAEYLFMSRDGYFPQKLFERFVRSKAPQITDSKYFYASRAAICNSAVVDIDDLKVFCSTMDPRYNLIALFHDRFGVKLDDSFNMTLYEAEKIWGSNWIEKKIGSKFEGIFEVQRERRVNYIKYIDSLKINNRKPICVIDLVTRGTTAFGLGRIMDKPNTLLSMGGIDIPNDYRNADNAKCMMGRNCTCRKFYQWFSILEIAYGSEEEQCAGFDKDGKPYFAMNSRYNPQMLIVQNTIMDELSEYIDADWLSNRISADFAEKMLDIMAVDHSDIHDNVIKCFSTYDSLDPDNHYVNPLMQARTN